MSFRRSVFTVCVFGVLSLVGCGGGGGGSNNACSTLKIAGGDSCSNFHNVAYLKADNGHCTGAYISLTSVLTAAHCVIDARRIEIFSKGNYREAVSAAVHPLYDGSKYSPFDMAIIKVNAPLQGGGPLPILLSYNPQIGEEVTAFGYGLDEQGRLPTDRILQGEFPLKAANTVFAGYTGGTSTILSTGDGSTCGGDSGGPVVVRSPSGAVGIIGITRSGPIGCSAPVGRPSWLSSTQSNGAIQFLSERVPDFAVE